MDGWMMDGCWMRLVDVDEIGRCWMMDGYWMIDGWSIGFPRVL